MNSAHILHMGTFVVLPLLGNENACFLYTHLVYTNFIVNFLFCLFLDTQRTNKKINTISLYIIVTQIYNMHQSPIKTL